MRQANLPLAKQKALPSVQLIHGDCLEVMPTLPANSVQMVFADLPYGITSQNQWDVCLCSASVWENLERLAVNKAAIVMTATQPFASDLVYSNRKHFRYDLIWQKGRPVGFANARKMPLRSHETLLVFYRSLPVYNPQKTKGGRTYSSQMGGRSGRNYSELGLDGMLQENRQGINYPRSVIALPCVNNRKSLHPTQKPVTLLEWLIQTYTNEADTVLDPVFGSATTAIACLRTGRNFIGIEKDAEYFRIGSERVRAEQERLSNL